MHNFSGLFMLKSLRIKAALVALVAGIAIFCPDVARADDPPALVGRLSYMEGSVSFHADGQDQWSYAGVNYPVTSGDAFWTQPDARDEIQIGSAIVRMDNATEMAVLHLDAATTQLQLDQGAINYRILQLDPGQAVEIETPHGAVSLVQPGTYHIEAGDDTHPTLVATLEGEARFIGPHSYLDIGAGEEATAIGDPASYTMSEAVTTPFDDWALQRDEREREFESVKYVSPQVTGYQDLDTYGTWQTVPQYGPVWIPASVPAEWAPYRVGHWAWVQPWGWTWIDDQPWGFAPFHYGRWAQINDRWGWVPGPVVPRPVYAPALVVFIGGAPGVGVSLAGSIGWLPLAPNEVYYPPYHPSLRYLRNVNNGPVEQGQINRITNNYVSINRTVNNYANASAATVVPQQAFISAQSVQRAAIKTPGQLQASAVTANLTALKPTPAARTAPGPSPQQQHEETQAIKHAEPQSLNTAGKEQATPAPQRASVFGQTHPEPTDEHHNNTGAIKPEPQITSREIPSKTEEPNAETRPAAEPRREGAAREPGIPAPGPTIKMPRPEVPLRQVQLAKALAAKPEAAEQPAPHPQGVQPLSHPAVQPAAFRPAQIEHPKQSAPLQATPQGWHRQTAEPKAEEKREEPQHDDKKEEQKK